MPYWLNLSGNMIMELPIMELAIAMPVMKADLPIEYKSINVKNIKITW